MTPSARLARKGVSLGISLIISSFSLALLGLVSLTLWRSTINGTNPRNGSFGIRTKATKQNDAAWVAGHVAAAPSLRSFGYVDIGLTLSLMIAGFAAPNLGTAATVVALVVAYCIAVGGFVYCAVKADRAAKEVDVRK